MITLEGYIHLDNQWVPLGGAIELMNGRWRGLNKTLPSCFTVHIPDEGTFYFQKSVLPGYENDWHRVRRSGKGLQWDMVTSKGELISGLSVSVEISTTLQHVAKLALTELPPLPLSPGLHKAHRAEVSGVIQSLLDQTDDIGYFEWKEALKTALGSGKKEYSDLSEKQKIIHDDIAYYGSPLNLVKIKLRETVNPPATLGQIHQYICYVLSQRLGECISYKPLRSEVAKVFSGQINELNRILHIIETHEEIALDQILYILIQEAIRSLNKRSIPHNTENIDQGYRIQEYPLNILDILLRFSDPSGTKTFSHECTTFSSYRAIVYSLIRQTNDLIFSDIFSEISSDLRKRIEARKEYIVELKKKIFPVTDETKYIINSRDEKSFLGSLDNQEKIAILDCKEFYHENEWTMLNRLVTYAATLDSNEYNLIRKHENLSKTISKLIASINVHDKISKLAYLMNHVQIVQYSSYIKHAQDVLVFIDHLPQDLRARFVSSSASLFAHISYERIDINRRSSENISIECILKYLEEENAKSRLIQEILKSDKLQNSDMVVDLLRAVESTEFFEVIQPKIFQKIVPLILTNLYIFEKFLSLLPNPLTLEQKSYIFQHLQIEHPHALKALFILCQKIFTPEECYSWVTRESFLDIIHGEMISNCSISLYEFLTLIPESKHDDFKTILSGRMRKITTDRQAIEYALIHLNLINDEDWVNVLINDYDFTQERIVEAANKSPIKSESLYENLDLTHPYDSLLSKVIIINNFKREYLFSENSALTQEIVNVYSSCLKIVTNKKNGLKVDYIAKVKIKSELVKEHLQASAFHDESHLATRYSMNISILDTLISAYDPDSTEVELLKRIRKMALDLRTSSTEDFKRIYIDCDDLGTVIESFFPLAEQNPFIQHWISEVNKRILGTPEFSKKLEQSILETIIKHHEDRHSILSASYVKRRMIGYLIKNTLGDKAKHLIMYMCIRYFSYDLLSVEYSAIIQYQVYSQYVECDDPNKILNTFLELSGQFNLQKFESWLTETFSKDLARLARLLFYKHHDEMQILKTIKFLCIHYDQLHSFGLDRSVMRELVTSHVFNGRSLKETLKFVPASHWSHILIAVNILPEDAAQYSYSFDWLESEGSAHDLSKITLAYDRRKGLAKRFSQRFMTALGLPGGNSELFESLKSIESKINDPASDKSALLLEARNRLIDYFVQEFSRIETHRDRYTPRASTLAFLK